MNIIVVFTSATFEQKASRLFSQSGIICYSAKPPVGIVRGSCAHGLKIYERDIELAGAKLLSARVPFVGIFKVGANGSFFEAHK